MANYYVLDRKKRTTGVFSNSLDDGCPFKDTYTYDVNTGWSTVEIEVPGDHKEAASAEMGGFLIFPDHTNRKLLMVKIIDIDDEAGDGTKRLIKAESAHNDLLSDRVRPYVLQNGTADQALEHYLLNTGYEVGQVDSVELKEVKAEDYPTIQEAIIDLAKQFGLYPVFRVEYDETRGLERKIVDLLSNPGRRKGQLFDVTQNMKEVKRKQSIRELYTGVIPLGKSGDNNTRLDISNVSWSIGNGDPADKPPGPDYIIDDEATQKFGEIGPDGVLKPILGRYENNEITDPYLLALEGWKWLQENKEIAFEYESNVLDLYDLAGLEHEEFDAGDIVTVRNTDINPPILVEAMIDFTKRSHSDPTDGDFNFSNYRDIYQSESDKLRALLDKVNRDSGTWDVTGRDWYEGPDAPDPAEFDTWLDTTKEPYIWKKWDDGIENWIRATATQPTDVGTYGTGTIDQKDGAATTAANNFTVARTPQVYSQPSPPVGDIPDGSHWLNTSEKRWYKYNGSIWVLQSIVDLSELEGVVTQGQIGIGAISEEKLSNLAVTLDKLANNSVTVDKIVNDAITNDKLATNSVGNLEIVDRAIANSKIKLDAIDNSLMANNSINTSEIVNNAINNAKMAANSVGSANIVDRSILNDKIGLDAIDNTLMAIDSVNTDQIVNRALSGGKIALDAITADLVALGAIGSTELANGAVVSGKVADDAIGTTNIIDRAMTGLKIALDSIDNSLMADGSINSEQLTAGSIISGKIGTNAVGSTNIVDGSVIAGKVAEASIGATEVIDRSMSNLKIALDSIDNTLMADGSVKAEQIVNGSVVSGKLGTSAVGSGNIASNAVISGKVAANAIGSSQVVDRAMSNLKIALDAIDNTLMADGSIQSEQLTVGSVIAGKIGSNAVTASEIAAGAVGTSEIVDKALTTAKIALGAIDNSLMADDAISTSKIVNRAITRTEIALATIDNENVKDRTLAAGKIIANSLTAGEIASRTITAGLIAAGTLTANEIKSATITGNRLVSGTITATQIAGTTITADKLVANSITAGQIAANAVTASEIAANSVDATHIVANSITAAQIAAGTITTDLISAAGLNADVIKAGIISSDRIRIGSGTLFDEEYEPTSWKKTYDVNTANPMNLVEYDGSPLNDSYTYEVTGRTTPTGTETTSICYFVSKGDGNGWDLNVQYEMGKSSNHPKFFIDSNGRPSVTLYDHTSFYNVEVKTTKTRGRQVPSQITNDQIVLWKYSDTTLLDGGKIYTNTVTANQIKAGTITTSEIASRTIQAGNIVANSMTANELAANSVNTSELVAGSVTATQVATDTLTAAQIAANAVTASEIAANSVNTSELVANAVTATQIASTTILAGNVVAGTLTSNEIKTRSIVAGDLVADTITAGEIATNAVTATEIAANTITAGQVAANTITAGQIASRTITAGLIDVGQITSYEISSRSIVAGDIVADGITAGEMAANSINTSELVANAVTATQIAANTITASEIAGRTITAGLIQSGAITANEIASRTIVAGDIVTGTLTSNEIASRTIVAGDIVADTITASEIATNAVRATEIASNTITAGQIAGRTITANEIAANVITANEIAANTITAGNIQSNSITSDKLNVLAKNLINNFSVTGSLMDWTDNKGGSFTSGTVYSGQIVNDAERGKVLKTNPSTQTYYYSNEFEVDPTQDYKLTMGVKVPNNIDRVYLGIETYDENGNELGTDQWNGSYDTNFYFWSSPSSFSDWFDITGYLMGANSKTVKDVPGGNGDYVKGTRLHPKTKYVQIRFLHYMNGSEAFWYSPSVTAVSGGAITANQIVSNTITASEIQAGTITSTEIKSNTIRSNEIVGGTITSTEIASRSIVGGDIVADTLTASEIATNAITANEIAANSVGASEVITDSLTASQIAANAITASEIASNSVNTAELVAGAVTATQIASRTITADRIQSGVITANEIASNAITAGKIAANAVTAGTIAAGSITTNHIATTGITADVIKGGTISGDLISGGTISGTNIMGDNTTIQNSLVINQSQGKGIVIHPGWSSASDRKSTIGITGVYIGTNENVELAIMPWEQELTTDKGITSLYGQMNNWSYVHNKYILHSNFNKDGYVRVNKLAGVDNTNIIPIGSYSGAIDSGGNFVRWKASDTNYIRQYGVDGSIDFYMKNSSASSSTAVFNMEAKESYNHGLFTIGQAALKGLSSSPTLQVRDYYDGNYRPITASAFNVGSSKKFKKNIKKSELSALEKVNNTTVYEYDMDVKDNEGKEKQKRNELFGPRKRKRGLIVEESPVEIIDDTDGETVDLYEMNTMLWKALQELSEEVRELKKKK